MAVLPENLDHKPSHDTRQKIFQAFFGTSLARVNHNHSQQYFSYYERELAMLKFGSLTSTATSRNELLVTTHTDLIEIVDVVRSAADNKLNLIQALQKRHPGTDATASRTLNLFVRLWLMLNVREAEALLHAPQTYLLHWSDKQTLPEFVAEAFPTSRWKIEAKDSRLHPSFTAVFMVDICGLKLEWTDCLADHLRLDRRHNALRVYSYKGLLQAHLNTYQSTGANNESPLPERLLMETIWSLNLLFPQWDQNTNALLKKHQQTFQQAGPYNGPPTLNLAEFQYWRDRLMELHDVVFLAPPASWAQLWRDRRNPQQFWTFWLALVILWLTLISTVAGIVQAWASIKSLDS